MGSRQDNIDGWVSSQVEWSVEGDQTSISVHQFNVALQQGLSYCGLDTDQSVQEPQLSYGRACHVAEQGYSDAQTRALGRWKSDAFKVSLRSEVLYAN